MTISTDQRDLHLDTTCNSDTGYWLRSLILEIRRKLPNILSFLEFAVMRSNYCNYMYHSHSHERVRLDGASSSCLEFVSRHTSSSCRAHCICKVPTIGDSRKAYSIVRTLGLRVEVHGDGPLKPLHVHKKLLRLTASDSISCAFVPLAFRLAIYRAYSQKESFSVALHLIRM